MAAFLALVGLAGGFFAASTYYRYASPHIARVVGFGMAWFIWLLIWGVAAFLWEKRFPEK